MKSIKVFFETTASSQDVYCCQVAVVELTKALINKIMRRKLQLQAVSEGDKDAQCIEYWDTNMTYFYGSNLDDEDLDKTLEHNGWCELTEKQYAKAGFSRMEVERVELERMVIMDYGMWWSCAPKHLTHIVETRPITYAVLREFEKRLEDDA